MDTSFFSGERSNCKPEKILVTGFVTCTETNLVHTNILCCCGFFGLK